MLLMVTENDIFFDLGADVSNLQGSVSRGLISQAVCRNPCLASQ